MKTIYIFIVIALLQLFVPIKMIFDKETVLTHGTAYKFKTQPVDPYDPFRGKYITLRYNIDRFKTKDSIWTEGETVYAYLGVDSLGFAKIGQISKQPLQYKNSDYIKVKVDYYSNYSKKLHLKFPFNRYYMEENKAYKAELAVRENQRNTLENNTYGLVYIKAGEAVLKDVIINDMSIKTYVEIE